MKKPNSSCPYLHPKETPFKALNSSSSSENASSKALTKKYFNKSLSLIVILNLFSEDLLTITHTLFSHNPEAKSFVTKKINELFISLKRKLINSAKYLLIKLKG